VIAALDREPHPSIDQPELTEAGLLTRPRNAEALAVCSGCGVEA